MGHNFNYAEGQPSSFSCTPSQVGTSTTIRLTLTDTGYKLTTQKQIRQVLKAAINTYVAAESADLISNGDTAVTTGLETDYHPGDGYALWTFDYANKRASITLTAVTSLNVSTPFAVSAPYTYSH